MRYDSDIVLASVGDKLSKLRYQSTGIPDNDITKEFALENYFTTKLAYGYKVPHVFHEEKPMVYDYDPRLTNAVFLHQITKQFQRLGDVTQIELPFSWYDWSDLSVLNGYIELPPSDKPGCDYVCRRSLRKTDTAQLQKKIDKLHALQNGGSFSIEDDGVEDSEDAAEKESMPKISPRALSPRRARVRNSREAKNCAKYCKTDKSPNQPGFRIFRQLFKGKPNLKTVHGRSFLYSEAPSPNSIVLVTKKGNLQINVKSNDQLDNKQDHNMVNSGFVQELVRDRSADINILEIYHDLLETLPISKPNELNFKYKVDLTHDDFTFNAPEYLDTHTPNTRYEKAFQDSLHFSLQNRDEVLKKYLNEAMLARGTGVNGGHFDSRFFNDGKYSDEERQAVLTRLLRTWFALTSNAGLLSWVSHGALLAHEFNAVGFPWDDDLDIQMPFKHFARLAELYNSSIIVEDPEYGLGRFYLDTTNSITHRSKGNGLNRIDGRFIDTNTGFFIDVTALGVSPISLPTRYVEQYKTLPKKKDLEIENWDPNVILDDYYTWLTTEEELQLSKDDAVFAERMKKLKELRSAKPSGLTKANTLQERFDINTRLRVYNCRNEHSYVLEELSPLRLSYQDKVKVYLPNSAPTLLEREYKKQPKLTGDFRGYFFLPAIRNWVGFKTVLDSVDFSVFQDLNTAEEVDMVAMLDNDEVFNAYRRTYDASLLHEKESKIISDSAYSEEEKDRLLTELMMGRHFDPIFKDPFQSKLEALALEDTDVKPLIDTEKEKMKEQLKIEYAKTVDYTFGDSNMQLSHDFNKVSRTLKDDLYDYKFNGYQPDLDAKIVQLQKQIDSVSGKGDAMSKEDKEAVAKWQQEIMTLHQKKTKAEEEALAAEAAQNNEAEAKPDADSAGASPIEE
ncbi:Protein MNN4 [Cyberlindnera fabianii]|uniref:Protein MNN4 n=1 Tax=Cyberlindnera fabianii TaxID=36022 RepID=A0A1V2L840_CYBFA|nr:Protein MNN4 [Cyberlindnera fabianii]